MNNTENRSPEEIESDIERTRADFSSTIDAIQRKLSPSAMMDDAVDYALSTTPGAFSMNLVNQVRDNPIPVALIGIGIAWLMSSGQKSQDVDTYRRGSRSLRRPMSDGMYQEDYLAARDYGVDGQGDGMMDKMAAKASGAAEGIKDTASQVGQRISSTAASVTDKLHQAGQSARSQFEESAETVQQRLDSMRRKSQEKAMYAKDRTSEMLEEQPLVFAALGLALGAALGAALPTTRRENELMGNVRDSLVDRAKETAREQAETLKQTAQRVAETAKQEVERVAGDVSNAVSPQKDQAGQSPVAAGGSQFGAATPPSIH
jgi:ElaB/YqjD/DUF883 family membrane-anchored ribosome-binding protein